jgi:large subunit ribosomal protein L30
MAEKKTSSVKSGAKGTIRIKWVRSAICAPKKHKLIVRGLGFTRLNQVIEREDTPSIRGSVKKIPHLLEFVQ